MNKSKVYINIFVNDIIVSITGIYNRLQYYMFADFSIYYNIFYMSFCTISYTGTSVLKEDI